MPEPRLAHLGYILDTPEAAAQYRQLHDPYTPADEDEVAQFGFVDAYGNLWTCGIADGKTGVLTPVVWDPVTYAEYEPTGHIAPPALITWESLAYPLVVVSDPRCGPVVSVE